MSWNYSSFLAKNHLQSKLITTNSTCSAGMCDSGMAEIPYFLQLQGSRRSFVKQRGCCFLDEHRGFSLVCNSGFDSFEQFLESSENLGVIGFHITFFFDTLHFFQTHLTFEQEKPSMRPSLMQPQACKAFSKPQGWSTCWLQMKECNRFMHTRFI